MFHTLEFEPGIQVNMELFEYIWMLFVGKC